MLKHTLTLSPGLATLLANPAAMVAEPISFELRQAAAERRCAPWRGLLDRLVAGEDDADLQI